MSNKETKVFTFNESNQPIRVKVFNENLWFAAKDVAKALNISWSSVTLAQIPEEWKGKMNFITPGGEQQLTVISEAGMYKLAFRCQSSKRADNFTNWVASEVLPSIRRTGRYEAPGKADMPAPRHYTKEVTPRHRSKALMLFFDELSTWTTPADDADIARQFGVRREHVRQVARGTHFGIDVTAALVKRAMRNRERGIMREPVVIRRSREEWADDICALINKFMPLDGEEG